MMTKLKLLIKRLIYKLKYFNEVRIFRKNQNVHDLPDIFHYWSNKYLLPKEQQFGFDNPDEFFNKYCFETCEKLNSKGTIHIISIGSGNGELEVGIAKHLVDKGIKNFIIECMDINASMHKRTMQLAATENVSDHITTLQEDFNHWQADKKYDLILANQSLHHVVELEHLFTAIHQGLNEKGKFITSDMIGRNGHMRWPEALELVQEFWPELPKKYTYNNSYRRYEKKYINHDCSVRSFEGVRAQDVLPLLVEKFEFEMFLPFANVIIVFIDRIFGRHFDINKGWDLDFIDRVHQADEQAIMAGTIKPTQMMAVMTKSKVAKTQLINPILTPEFCIRKT
jgi:SAM-dependent methyltransferase